MEVGGVKKSGQKGRARGEEGGWVRGGVKGCGWGWGGEAHDVERQIGDVELAVLHPLVQPLGELDHEWLAALHGEKVRWPHEERRARRQAAAGGRRPLAGGRGRRSRGARGRSLQLT